MTKIKLCGLSRYEDIVVVNEIKPDYVGLIFYKNSKRYIPYARALKLIENLNREILPVGVFVNEKIDTVVEQVKNNVVSIVQLHGKENQNYIKLLKERIGSPIIKAFSISSMEDIKAANNSVADYVLLDSGNGGTGEEFNRFLLKYINRPYFLAGGLNINNIEDIVNKHCPYAVDVSSGIEVNGIKDKIKMEKFVKIVRKADVL
ncbi:MAG: phosphoribosylanthranilate isomerase [Lachnospirales bacterium]